MLFAAKPSRLSIYIMYAQSIQESLNPWDQMSQDFTFGTSFFFRLSIKGNMKIYEKF